MVLVAANLRTAITSVSPLLGTISRAERLTNLEQSVLSALPVLCFGLLAPLAVTIGRRFGLERAFALAMTLLAAGIAVRVLGGGGLLLGGTVVASSGIAVGNILVPAYVKQTGGQRSGLITGASIATMGAVAAVAAIASPALAGVLGGWREATGVWAAPALVAAACALGVARRGATADPQRQRSSVPTRPPLKVGREMLKRWGDIIVLTASQSIVYYSMLAWLPSVFESHGMSAGTAGSLLSLFSLVGLPLSVTIPSAVIRSRRRWLLVVAVTALTAGGLLGLVAAPLSLPYLWVTLIGLGQGGIFAWVMVIFLLRAETPEETAQLSLSAQMTGFLLATAGPFLLGEVHALTATWSVPLSLLAIVLLSQLVAGCRAGGVSLMRRPGLGDGIYDSAAE